jgi:hypothetical protein
MLSSGENSSLIHAALTEVGLIAMFSFFANPLRFSNSTRASQTPLGMDSRFGFFATRTV